MSIFDRTLYWKGEIPITLGDVIYEWVSGAVGFLTSVSFNIWGWLVLILPPILFLRAYRTQAGFIRISWILSAVFVGYVAINLALHTARALDRKEYERCNLEHGVDRWSDNSHPDCDVLINIADGLANVFYLFLGWLPVCAYLGLFVLLRKLLLKPASTFGVVKWSERLFVAIFIVCLSVPIISLSIALLT